MPRIARAQAYPTRPVRIIAPFAPGGPTDIIARLMGQWLSERLGQPFVIENRTGAGGNIGTEAVVRAPPDGYTLLMVGSDTGATNATLYDKLNFNFIRDIAPVAGFDREPLIMMVNPSVPVRTVAEFIVPCRESLNIISKAIGIPDIRASADRSAHDRDDRTTRANRPRRWSHPNEWRGNGAPA